MSDGEAFCCRCYDGHFGAFAKQVEVVRGVKACYCFELLVHLNLNGLSSSMHGQSLLS